MSTVKIEDIAYVRFQAPDLVEMRRFLEDFGLHCETRNGRLFGRGSDGSPFAHVTETGAPRFAGLGFRASSREDLEALAAQDRVTVRDADVPGGGYIVSLTDPDGNAIDVVAEQVRAIAEPGPAQPPVNSIEAQLRVGSPIRLEPGPSHVHRLGHAVLVVRDFELSQAWYKDRFGLLTSDQVEVERGAPIGAFLRCDRGDLPTDHHTLFLVQARDAPGFHHAAFEVIGFDDLMLGNSYLRSQHRVHSQGIGRHKLGSQIFDYWKDPWGHELEHWTDGDLFTAKDPPGVAGLEDLLGVTWHSQGGPDTLTPKPNAAD